jgi:hypothetical protein
MTYTPNSTDSVHTPSNATYIADDGTQHHGEAALRLGFGWVQLQEEQNREAVAQLTPEERDRFKHWLETRPDTTPPPVQPVRHVRPVRPVAGRAPRQATNARRRGSRRSTQRSSARSGDSGDDGPGPWRLRLLRWLRRLWRHEAAPSCDVALPPIGLELIGDEVHEFFVDPPYVAHPCDGRMEPGP